MKSELCILLTSISIVLLVASIGLMVYKPLGGGMAWYASALSTGAGVAAFMNRNSTTKGQTAEHTNG